MDKQRVAKELVGLAGELTAGRESVDEQTLEWAQDATESLETALGLLSNVLGGYDVVKNVRRARKAIDTADGLLSNIA